MPRAEPPALRRSSRSARACGAALAALLKGSGAVWPCGTITGASTCPTPSSRSLPFWASQARPPSCGRLREGCAERFIRTLKENLLWVRTFDTVEELRQALLDFRESYNTTWLIERHGFQTPAAVRQNQLSTAARAP